MTKFETPESLHRGVQDCLQAGAAAAVNLKPGDADAEPGAEGDHPTERRKFTGGAAVAEDDVVASPSPRLLLLAISRTTTVARSDADSPARLPN